MCAFHAQEAGQEEPIRIYLAILEIASIRDPVASLDAPIFLQRVARPCLGCLACGQEACQTNAREDFDTSVSECSVLRANASVITDRLALMSQMTSDLVDKTLLKSLDILIDRNEQLFLSE